MVIKHICATLAIKWYFLVPCVVSVMQTPHLQPLPAELFCKVSDWSPFPSIPVWETNWSLHLGSHSSSMTGRNKQISCEPMGHKWPSDQISAHHRTLILRFPLFPLVFSSLENLYRSQDLDRPSPAVIFCSTDTQVQVFSTAHLICFKKHYGSLVGCVKTASMVPTAESSTGGGKTHTHGNVPTTRNSDSEVYCCRILVHARKTRRNWRSVLIQIQLILHLWISLNLCKKKRYFLQQPPVDRAPLSPADQISEGE